MTTVVSFYNLSGLTLNPEITLKTSDGSSLDPQYWYSSDAPLPPSLTQARPLAVSRHDGLQSGVTYTFTLSFPINNTTAGFQIQLIGGKMQLNLFYANNTDNWWSTNDPQTILFQLDNGIMLSLTASLVSRFASSSPDVVLTFTQATVQAGPSYLEGSQWFTPGGRICMTLGDAGLLMTRTMFDAPLWSFSSPQGSGVSTASYANAVNGTLSLMDSANAVIGSLTLTPNPTNGPVQLVDTPDFQATTIQGSAVSTLGLPAIDWTSAVYLYTDQNGYQYCETSEYWKNMCQDLPCTLLLQWPGYQTAIVPTTLNGQPAIIQVWRGHCQRFLGLESAPGGYGAEVGVYTVEGWLSSPSNVDQVPGLAAYAKVMQDVTDSTWWPAPQLVQSISFNLINPNTNEVFVASQSENTYWNCKWMVPDSYAQYQKDQNGNVPDSPDGYPLQFWVNGQEFMWPVDGDPYAV